MKSRISLTIPVAMIVLLTAFLALGEPSRAAEWSLKTALRQVDDATKGVRGLTGEVAANIKSVFGARADAYGGKPEVSQTLVQVAALILPELKIEIKCVAHL